MDLVNDALAPLQGHPWALMLLQLVALLFAVWLANWVTRSLLVRAFSRGMRLSVAGWDDALVGRRVFARLANVVPALVTYHGIGLVSGLPAGAVVIIRNVASAYVVLTLVLALANLMSAFGDIYEKRDPDRARERPIKGYLQVAKIVAYLVAAVLIAATLFNRDPLLLLSGLGAMTAVLMLIFKDTILSLVASVQLSSNDMLRVGDWIAMPQLHADGFVIDVSLHTIKVQNWDKTITTIPTWRLISESYVQAYVETHPGINARMFRVVRQLQSGPTGLPLEIYCYTADTAWAVHEGIQDDIFDHLYAILPDFGLCVFQQPSGADVNRALRA